MKEVPQTRKNVRTFFEIKNMHTAKRLTLLGNKKNFLIAPLKLNARCIVPRLLTFAKCAEIFKNDKCVCGCSFETV